jgi:hypothetical protein
MSISGHRTRAVFDRYDIASTKDRRDALRRTEAYVQSLREVKTGGNDVVTKISGPRRVGPSDRRARALASVAEETATWPYRRDRDLTGFIDGTENLALNDAPDVVLMPVGNSGASTDHDRFGKISGGTCPAGRSRTTARCSWASAPTSGGSLADAGEHGGTRRRRAPHAHALHAAAHRRVLLRSLDGAAAAARRRRCPTVIEGRGRTMADTRMVDRRRSMRVGELTTAAAPLPATLLPTSCPTAPSLACRPGRTAFSSRWAGQRDWTGNCSGSLTQPAPWTVSSSRWAGQRDWTANCSGSLTRPAPAWQPS